MTASENGHMGLAAHFYKGDNFNLDFSPLGRVQKIQYWLLPQVSWSLTKDMKIIFRRNVITDTIHLYLKSYSIDNILLD